MRRFFFIAIFNFRCSIFDFRFSMLKKNCTIRKIPGRLHDHHKRIYARHLHRKLGAEAVQGRPAGRDAGSIPVEFHLFPGHDDEGGQPVPEGAQGVGAPCAAAQPVGYAVSGGYPRGGELRSRQESRQVKYFRQAPSTAIWYVHMQYGVFFYRVRERYSFAFDSHPGGEILLGSVSWHGSITASDHVPPA